MILTRKPMRAGIVSRAALGAALALGLVGGGAMFATPAMAAKEQKAPALKLTPNFQKVAAPLQKAVNDAKARPDVVAAKGKPAQLAQLLSAERSQVDQLFTIIGSEDDRFVAGQFGVTLGSIAEDTALQRRGIDAMLQSGKLPAGEVPKLQFLSGQLAFQAKDYVNARRLLQGSLDGGYKENDPSALIAETYLAEGQTQQGLTMLQQAIDRQNATGKPAPDTWYKRGLFAAYNAKAGPQASAFGTKLVQAYPTQENWGVAITIIREIGGIPGQDMLDLLRLMGRTNSYNESRDYLEYIEAADPRRLPGEALAVIDAGTKANAFKPAVDRLVGEYRATANQRIAADRASLPSLERDARAPNAAAALVTANADAFLSYGESAKAEALYALALTKPGVDAPRALTRMGIAQSDQGKYTEARASFAKVTGPRKPIADLWGAYVATKAKPAA
jgi:tetratricopeptide (TPR) repeat protein